MAELKECPFCGWKKARIISRYSPGGRRIRYIDKFQLQTHERKYYVRCNRCFAHGGIVSGQIMDSFVKAIPSRMAWEDRVEHLFVDEENQQEEAEKPALPSWVTTKERLQEKAAALWNMRKEASDDV